MSGCKQDMIKSYKIWIILVFLCMSFLSISISSQAYSGMISVYVDYKPLNTEYIIILDEVFAPADDLVLLLKENITWDPSTLWIKIGNKEIPQKGLDLNGKVFLPLKALVREIGYVMEWDQEKGILNIDTKRKVDSPSAGKENVSRRKRKGVTIKLFQEESITNILEQCIALRISADVINEKIRAVENIEAHCIFRFPEGNVFYDDVIRIERLEPGESKRVVFYSTNPLNEGKLEYELKVEIKKKVMELERI